MRTKLPAKRNSPVDLDEHDLSLRAVYDDWGDEVVDDDTLKELRARASPTEIIVRLLVPAGAKRSRRRGATSCAQVATLQVRADDRRSLAEVLTELVVPVGDPGPGASYDVRIDDEYVKLHAPLVSAPSTGRLKPEQASRHTMDVITRSGRFSLAKGRVFTRDANNNF